MKMQGNKTQRQSPFLGLTITPGSPEEPVLSLIQQGHVKEEKKVKSLSRVQLFVIPYTVAHQAPLSMEFSRQEYWSGLPFPSPGDLPDPGIEPGSPTFRQTFYRLTHVNILTSEVMFTLCQNSRSFLDKS